MKDYRLTEKELFRLKQWHRNQRSKKLADRIKAVYLLGSDWAVADICKALLLDENTIYRYYDIYQSEDIKGLLKTKHKGREQQLTDKEQCELDKYLEDFPCRTTKQVIDYVRGEYDVEYSVSGMNALLKRMGYTYKKPRVVPGKADTKAQRRFVKKYRKIREEMSAEDSLFFMDGVHPQHNPIVQYGWFKKGCKMALRTNTQYKRLHINGVVDIERLDIAIKLGSRLDEELTLDTLERLRVLRPRGQLYLVLDNAGYYNTYRVRQYAGALGITLLFLPPYSPNLNLIERLWRLMQRNILYNHYYPTFDEMKQSVLSFFKGLRFRKDELRTLLAEKFETLPQI